jgi:hypothetical protein
VVMGQEENSDAHWESADAEWRRQYEGAWDNYVPYEGLDPEFETHEESDDPGLTGVLPLSLLTEW